MLTIKDGLLVKLLYNTYNQYLTLDRILHSLQGLYTCRWGVPLGPVDCIITRYPLPNADIRALGNLIEKTLHNVTATE